MSDQPQLRVGYTQLLEQDLKDLAAGVVNPAVKQGAVNFLTGAHVAVEMIAAAAPVKPTFAYTQLTPEDMQKLAEGVVSEEVKQGAESMLALVSGMGE